MNRRPMEVLAQVQRAGADPLGLLIRRRHRSEVLGRGVAVDLRQRSPLVGAGYDHPAPPLSVTAGRGLLREANAIEEHLPLDRSVEIKAPTDGTSRG